MRDPKDAGTATATVDVVPLLDLALHMANRADDIALAGFGADVKADIKPDGSPVTRVDREIESMLRDTVCREHPQAGVLGEEYGEEGVWDVGYLTPSTAPGNSWPVTPASRRSWPTSSRVCHWWVLSRRRHSNFVGGPDRGKAPHTLTGDAFRRQGSRRPDGGPAPVDLSSVAWSQARSTPLRKRVSGGAGVGFRGKRSGSRAVRWTSQSRAVRSGMLPLLA